MKSLVKKIKIGKLKAFTLLECLVALLVLSGSVLVIQGLTKVIHTEMIRMQNLSEADWQSFCAQLNSELLGSTLVKVENNFLYIQKNNNLFRFGFSTGDDFRKANANGQGFQPMIHQVKACQIIQTADLINIQLTFNNGEKKWFIYKFSKNQ